MKIRIDLKDPDGVDESIRQQGLDGNEAYESATLKKFIRYGEYVSIEIDTETQTARVIPTS